MGHLSLILLFSLGAGFLALRSGHATLAGLAFSLLAIKPQWAILPGLLLLFRQEWRAAAVMVVASTVIVFLPFLFMGRGILEDYFAFLRNANAEDLQSAPHMFSWNGFLSKLNPANLYLDPDAGINMTLFFLLEGVTVALVLIVWRGRDFYLSVSATVIGMLLLSTRSVWYDWAFLTIPAIFLVLRPASQMVRAQVWVLLLALVIAASQSMAALFAPDGRHGNDHWIEPAFFSLTLVAFAVLVWMAGLTIWERRGALLTLPRWGPLRLAMARGR